MFEDSLLMRGQTVRDVANGNAEVRFLTEYTNADVVQVSLLFFKY